MIHPTVILGWWLILETQAGQLFQLGIMRAIGTIRVSLIFVQYVVGSLWTERDIPDDVEVEE